jgi:S1-C subfamily serine protease
MRPEIFPSVKRALALTVVLSFSAVPVVAAQGTVRSGPVRVYSGGAAPQLLSLLRGTDMNRAVIGVTLGGDSPTDTAGIRLEAVDADGPAAKAGLKAGDVLTEINGVSLRLSKADAEDPALTGISQRRLQRTMAKLKAGDNVTLRVQSGGTSKTVTVKTVSAADLAGTENAPLRRLTSTESDKYGAIGVSIGGTGTLRDTLGLFVSAVTADGPAESAGIIEGVRIASVNGVDVRVPKEDAKDAAAASARVSRFVKAVQDVGPGGKVSLRVYSGGQYRDLTVTAVKMSELPNSDFGMFFGGDQVRVLSPRSGDGGTFQWFGPEGREPFIIRRDGGTDAKVRVRINGQDIDPTSEDFEDAMTKLRDQMKGLGEDLRFNFQQGPMLFRQRAPVGTDETGARRILPRRTVTIL